MDKQAKIESLARACLTSDQAEVYVALLMRGRITASKLKSQTSLSRPMLYRVLGELTALGVVLKEDAPQMVSRFECAHPLKLRELVDIRRAEVATRQQSLENILSSLVSDYTALSGKPGMRLLSGIIGIEELYEDILNEGVGISLIRSPYDDKFPELTERVIKQIAAQVKAGITTRAITPFDNETLEELEGDDVRNLVTRRLVYLEKLDIPAQIILYADKVAITAFDTELMTTIIQNQAISKSFALMFEFMWHTVASDDAEIRTGLKNGTLTAPRPRA
jgi:sugar-specific transcriptional regulator TrmB